MPAPKGSPAPENSGETTEATGWKPEPGDTVDGRLVELDRGWSDYQNAFYPILVLEKGDGERVNVHCFHAVLKNRLLAKQPAIGDRLIISYHGKRPSKDGKREVSIYTVETPDREQDAASFWQGMGADPATAGSQPASGPAAPAPDIPVDEDDIPF